MSNLTTSPKLRSQKVKSIKGCNVNASDIDLVNLCKTINAKWAQSPWLTIRWATTAKFAIKISEYSDILDFRLKNGRSSAQAIKIIEKSIKKTAPKVRGYIFKKYKESSKSYYPLFGISSKSPYLLPNDPKRLSKALELMVNGIAENGFGDKEYGTVYWTDIKKQYDLLLQDALTADRAISNNLTNKNKVKKEMKEVINAIAGIITINYPGTFETELGNWGFEKKRYY
jgi:ribosomal protein S17E